MLFVPLDHLTLLQRSRFLISRLTRSCLLDLIAISHVVLSSLKYSIPVAALFTRSALLSSSYRMKYEYSAILTAYRDKVNKSDSCDERNGNFSATTRKLKVAVNELNGIWECAFGAHSHVSTKTDRHAWITSSCVRHKRCIISIQHRIQCLSAKQNANRNTQLNGAAQKSSNNDEINICVSTLSACDHSASLKCSFAQYFI